MRFRDWVIGGSVTENMTISGTQMRAALTLKVAAASPYAAVTKTYVDAKTAVFGMHQLIRGTAPYGCFTGDVGGGADSHLYHSGSSLVLKTTGVTQGVYCTVVLDTDGRVKLGHGKVDSSAMPPLSWVIVNSGKPTTASGYGITDALTVQGGDIVGRVSLVNDPSADHHASTKKYAVQAALACVAPTATQRLSCVQTARSGWLQCNGGAVSKVLYASLYTAIGDVYTDALAALGVSTDPAFFRLPDWVAPSNQGAYLHIKT